MSSILTNIAGLQVFFASVKALPCRYLLQAPSFSLRPKSGQICFKQSYPATTPPVSQSGTQGQTGRKKGEPFWLAYSCVFLFYISYLIKSLLTDICSKHLLFTFAQNRGKFALNCFSLQLLHLLRKAAHKGKQDAKKGEPFNGSSCYVVFCSVNFYTLLMKTTPNSMGFFQEILSFVPA